MARQDIHADTVNGDVTTTDNLVNKLIYDFILLEEAEGENNEHYVYGEIPVPANMESKLSENAVVYTRIAYIPIFKELKIRFRLETGDGNENCLINRTDNRIWFPVFCLNEEEEKIPANLSELHDLNETGIFSLVFKTGYLALYSGNETDLEIKPAINQNEVFLLKAMAGNLYHYPSTGVGLIEFLHGNFENNGLADKLQQEFENDNMIIENAYMDSVTGELFLDVKEKNG